MKKTILILSLLAFIVSGCGQTAKIQSGMDNHKTQSLCILEETKEYVMYLIHLERDERERCKTSTREGDFFLRCRCEKRYVNKKEDNQDYQERDFVLHFFNEKLVDPVTMNSHDGWVIEKRTHGIKIDSLGRVFFEENKCGMITEAWETVSNTTHNDKYTKILDYYLSHQSEIPVIQDLAQDQTLNECWTEADESSMTWNPKGFYSFLETNSEKTYSAYGSGTYFYQAETGELFVQLGDLNVKQVRGTKPEYELVFTRYFQILEKNDTTVVVRTFPNGYKIGWEIDSTGKYQLSFKGMEIDELPTVIKTHKRFENECKTR